MIPPPNPTYEPPARRLATRARRTIRAALADDITGEAARIAFYFFLSLFPLILALFALTGIVGGAAAFDWIMAQIRAAVPASTAELLGEFVAEVTGDEKPGLLTLGVLLTVWSASNIFGALGAGLNVMYDIEETRPFWKKKLLALGLMVAGLILMASGAAAILAGPAIAEALGLGFAWIVLRWPLSFALLLAFFWLSYYFLPNRDRRGAARDVLIGALVGATVWILATLLFRIYVANFGSYSATYGFVGAIIVLLLWLYLTGIAMLFGGEVAAELEQRQRDVGLSRAPTARARSGAEVARMTQQGNGGAATRSPEDIRRDIAATRERLSANFDRLNLQIEQKSAELREKADVLRTVRERVRRAPLPTVGIAFGLGAVAGLLGGRGRADEDEDEPALIYVEDDEPVAVRRRPVDRDLDSDDVAVSAPGRQSFLRELGHVLASQLASALIAAVAGVITAKLSQDEMEEAVERGNASGPGEDW
ncbi:MAG: YhjD/YihY/BrkB family envelope integrity protein [Longimicrobiales bacterium]